MLLFQSMGCWHFHSEVRRNWDHIHFSWQWVKNLCFKIEANLCKELRIPNQAEGWTWVLLFSDNCSSDRPIGYLNFFFTPPCFNLSPVSFPNNKQIKSKQTKKNFMRTSISLWKICFYAFFGQNPSFFIKFPYCSSFWFSNIDVAKVVFQLLSWQNKCGVFLLGKPDWNFFLLLQDVGLLFN